MTAPAEASGGLHRRPSGEPPPLPRQFDRATVFWLTLAAIGAAVWVIVVTNDALSHALSLWEGEVVRSLTQARPAGLDGPLTAIHDTLFTWLVPIVGWGTMIALAVLGRWRHLVVYLASLLVTSLVVGLIELLVTRPRPLGVEILGRWESYSQPQRPVAMATAAVVGALLALVPPGRTRRWLPWVVLAGLAAYGFLECLLGVSHPTDAITAVLVGATVPVLAFRLFAPESVFPVSLRRGGNAAHLDVSGPRGDAIRTAVEAQLGLRVTDVRPIGDEGSAGSTPLILTVVEADTGDERPPLFAKLLANSHLRSDRFYKLFRTLRYGRLEDEHRFQTVRRLVQQEDYLGLRFLDSGVTVPRSLGVVEITPEREYLLVTEFLDGFAEIGKVDIDDAVIDHALVLVRRLWDVGLAHRDVKPANIMVRGDEVALIDVGFAEVRPSPWRQAVDLANMLLVLALRTDAPTVYEHALRYFTPDEVAEAFAATSGMTVPSQTRRELKRDGRDLIGEFRALAPPLPSIHIQRWSTRRIGLTAAVALGVLVGVSLLVANLQDIGLLP